MTPEERATAVVTDRRPYVWDGQEPICLNSFIEAELIRRVAAAIDAAVAAEREACALLCERIRGERMLPAAGTLDCAAAIRARGGSTG